MIIGMNSETEYLGKTYHIQTEDGGRQNPVITTQVFLKGAILVTQKTNYADILKAEFLEEIVKDLMRQQHVQVIRELRSGKLLEKKAGQAAAPPPTTPPEHVSPPPPGPDNSRKTLDDMILDYLVGEEEKDNS
jgi:hypothetical protein